MTANSDPGPTLTVGGDDSELQGRLHKELMAFNIAATGTADTGDVSIRLADENGELVGGLTAGIWGGLCHVELLWVRGDSRGHGWGSRILQALEDEAVRRGCDRIALFSYTFQAPGFYQKCGYVEVARLPDVPVAGHQDVYLVKQLKAHPAG